MWRFCVIHQFHSYHPLCTLTLASRNVHHQTAVLGFSASASLLRGQDGEGEEGAFWGFAYSAGTSASPEEEACRPGSCMHQSGKVILI